MVVVVGGVGKLAGVIFAGGGLGFVNKYLEPLFGGTGSVIYGKITVLALIILFLQWRPSGLFPPKGRTADA
jgi:urea transport system permease protein